MSYRIEWDEGVLRDLASVWNELPSKGRVEITDTLEDVDRLLKRDAPRIGESRSSEWERILHIVPLVIRFKVEPRQRIARIVGARVYKK